MKKFLVRKSCLTEDLYLWICKSGFDYICIQSTCRFHIDHPTLFVTFFNNFEDENVVLQTDNYEEALTAYLLEVV